MVKVHWDGRTAAAAQVVLVLVMVVVVLVGVGLQELLRKLLGELVVVQGSDDTNRGALLQVLQDVLAASHPFLG